jgi:NADPH:quinone reductase-like Zn-dependent oxidoreductase
LFGARVIATSSSDAKAERLRALGADAVVNYRTTPGWHREVRELTGGRGVDQVVDVGGSTLEQSIRAATLDGLVNFVGQRTGNPVLLESALLFRSVVTVRVVFAGSRAQFEAMNRAIGVGGMRPTIDRVFPFEEVPSAFRYFETAQPFGKVVISHSRTL